MLRCLILFIAVLITTSLGTHKALASGPLFCLNAPGTQAQCIFHSADSCNDKVQNIARGFCSVNPHVMDIPKGPGLWCLVTSARHVQCYYDNFLSCNKQARNKNAICVRSRKNNQVSNEAPQKIPGF